MTKKKLSEWLNKQGYITTPEKITSIKSSQDEAEAGVHPLWITFTMKSFIHSYRMSCIFNLKEISQELKNNKKYKMKVTADKHGNYIISIG